MPEGVTQTLVFSESSAGGAVGVGGVGGITGATGGAVGVGGVGGITGETGGATAATKNATRRAKTEAAFFRLTFISISPVT